MTELASLFLGLGVIASFLLMGGGVAVLRRGDRKRGWLMVVAGAVIMANVWLYATLPPLPT